MASFCPLYNSKDTSESVLPSYPICNFFADNTKFPLSTGILKFV